jgi:hypothetical protein
MPDGEGGGPWEEFMAEDFCDEDVLGHVKRSLAQALSKRAFPGRRP